MRLVAVTVLKNEADIVEAFCRHTAAVVDHHVVFDHASTDTTLFLLERLRRDGLPITVLTDGAPGFHQGLRTTALGRWAVARFGPAWVLPLDADEFLQGESPEAVRAFFAGRAVDAAPPVLPLVNFGPHRTDDPTEPNPLLRFRHRERQPVCTKVFIPPQWSADPGVSISNGNHDLFRGPHPIPAERIDVPWLAHVPVRSGAQAALKALAHELQRRCGGYGTGGEQYRELVDRLTADPAGYLSRTGDYCSGIECDPARYWGQPVRYELPTPDVSLLAAGVTHAALTLADELGRVRSAGARNGNRFKRLLMEWFPSAQPTPSDRLGLGEFRTPPDLPDSRKPERLSCDLSVIARPGSGRFVARVRNTGLCVWRIRTTNHDGVVNLGVQVTGPDGELTDWDFLRVPLPREIEPWETLELSFEVGPPPPGGKMHVRMVAEGVKWFGPAVGLGAEPHRRAA